MKYYTDLAMVFRAIGQRQREFNWLVTNLECNTLPEGLWDTALDSTPEKAWWFTGDELTRFVESHDIQFIWAVLSGFRIGVNPDLSHLDLLPCADGNGDLWKPGVRIQHPQAEVEIVCWDSGATLLLACDRELSQRFRSFFPEAVDLDEYNAARAKNAGSAK